MIMILCMSIYWSVAVNEQKRFFRAVWSNKSKFWAYYKDVFIFVGCERGEEITIWIDGNTTRVHNLDIDANKEYMLYDFDSMIDDATIETAEELFQVEFLEKKK